MQSPYDPSRMLNDRFMVMARPAGVGHLRTVGGDGLMHRAARVVSPGSALGYCSALMFMVLMSARAGAIDRMVEGFPDLPGDAREVAEPATSVTEKSRPA
jgi:hypothetical protein